MPDQKKMLFYCQHLVGVGHLTRSFALCNELSDAFAITFLQGGPDIGKRPNPQIRHIALPPLMLDSAEMDLVNPCGERPVAEILRDRSLLLSEILAEPYDFLGIEFFPFGRRKLRQEILEMIQTARARNPQIKIFCSLRDIMVEKPDFAKRDRQAAEIILSYFDFVLVHADPELVRLEETFSQTEAIQSKIVYTGYISEADGQTTSLAPERKRRILVSQGGGIVGSELLFAVMDITADFSDYEFNFVIGPNAPQGIRDTLRDRAYSKKNVQLWPFLANFEQELRQSCLSISMAGYNTTMNLLHTRTPALVYPYLANREQQLRSRKLAERGLLRVLLPEDLPTNILRGRITAALEMEIPAGSLNLAGAQHAKQFLQNVKAL